MVLDPRKIQKLDMDGKTIIIYSYNFAWLETITGVITFHDSL